MLQPPEEAGECARQQKEKHQRGRIGMNIKVGVAQIPNSTELDANFKCILSALNKFETTSANLVVFPECALSGFSSQMKKSNLQVLQPYFDQVQDFTNQTGIEVVLPFAIVEIGTQLVI